MEFCDITIMFSIVSDSSIVISWDFSALFLKDLEGFYCDILRRAFENCGEHYKKRTVMVNRSLTANKSHFIICLKGSEEVAFDVTVSLRWTWDSLWFLNDPQYPAYVSWDLGVCLQKDHKQSCGVITLNCTSQPEQQVQSILQRSQSKSPCI